MIVQNKALQMISLQHADRCVTVQMAMLKSETITHVRAVCINQVLGTDMKKHFDITSRFQAGFVFQLACSTSLTATRFPCCHCTTPASVLCCLDPHRFLLTYCNSCTGSHGRPSEAFHA